MAEQFEEKLNIFAENLLLLCIFYSQSTLSAGFVLPNGISAGVCSQRGFEIFFYATEGMNNLLYGCTRDWMFSVG